MNLAGKIAYITGASRGIGQAIALALGQQGATVIGTATTEAGALAISALLQEKGIAGQGMILKLSDNAAIEAVHQQIKMQYGAAPAILVNNAAITRDNLLLRMKEEEWSEVININLSAVFRVTKICLRDMLKAHFGRIITISSIVGLMGQAGQANYAAAKAGLLGFSKSLAQEVASRNITVNVIAPGFIETDMTAGLPEQHKEQLLSKIPAGRYGQAAEIAYAAAFLAAPQAGYITGQILQVNGGMYM